MRLQFSFKTHFIGNNALNGKNAVFERLKNSNAFGKKLCLVEKSIIFTFYIFMPNQPHFAPAFCYENFLVNFSTFCPEKNRRLVKKVVLKKNCNNRPSSTFCLEQKTPKRLLNKPQNANATKISEIKLHFR